MRRTIVCIYLTDLRNSRPQRGMPNREVGAHPCFLNKLAFEPMTFHWARLVKDRTCDDYLAHRPVSGDPLGHCSHGRHYAEMDIENSVHRRTFASAGAWDNHHRCRSLNFPRLPRLLKYPCMSSQSDDTISYRKLARPQFVSPQ